MMEHPSFFVQDRVKLEKRSVIFEPLTVEQSQLGGKLHVALGLWRPQHGSDGETKVLMPFWDTVRQRAPVPNGPGARQSFSLVSAASGQGAQPSPQRALLQKASHVWRALSVLPFTRER